MVRRSRRANRKEKGVDGSGSGRLILHVRLNAKNAQEIKKSSDLPGFLGRAGYGKEREPDMKSVFLGIFLSVLAAGAQAAVPCTLVRTERGGEHHRCLLPTADGGERAVDILRLKGSIAEAAYWHGRLLASEIADGTVPAVVRKIDYILKGMPEPRRFFFSKIKQCAMNKYRGSMSREFLDMHREIVRGMNDAGERSVSVDDFLTSSFATEFGIFADAFLKKMERNQVAALADISFQCGIEIPAIVFEDVMRAMGGAKNGFKTGCTGFVASGPQTTQGHLIHGRNFDHSLIGTFERHPVVILQEPPNGHRYVAVASAGVHYAGGVSGFNEKGISVSVHELQTEEVKLFQSGRQGVTGPFLANLILERADSIADAYALARSLKHFGAWTILVGDSKTDEYAAIELTGKRISITRQGRGESVAQTNHFTGTAMKGADIKLSFGHVLESRARFEFVSRRLTEDAGDIGVQWGINLLASHWDAFVGRRSFGRTPTKVYTTQSHVMVPAEGLFYTTYGEMYPTSNGAWLGLKVDFGAGTVRAFELRRPDERFYEEHPNWFRSLGEYIRAYMDYRNYGYADNANLKAFERLTVARDLAAQDGIFELPYHFLRGRLGILLDAARTDEADRTYLQEAIRSFSAIVAEYESGRQVMHPFEVGLAYLWLGRAWQLLGGEDAAAHAALRKALALHNTQLADEREQGLVQALIAGYYDATTGRFRVYTRKEAGKGELDFVTAE